MSYTQNGLIQASDFNVLAFGNENGTLNPNVASLNSILGTGYGSIGYGQSIINPVQVDRQVTADDWYKLVSNTIALGAHQGSNVGPVPDQPGIGSLPIPQKYNTVEFLTNLQSSIQTIYSNSMNAVNQSSPIISIITNNGSVKPWAESLTFTFQINFDSGDQARYFFNAGGQLKLEMKHDIPADKKTTENILFENITRQLGSIYLSAANTGFSTIKNVAFNGVTQLNASPLLEANPKLQPVLNSTCGYYALTTTDQVLVKQYRIPEQTGDATVYPASFVQITAKSNGPQGFNGDAGSQLTVTVKLNEFPTGKLVNGTTTCVLSVIPPSERNLIKTWGNVSIVSTVVNQGVENVVIPPPPASSFVCISVIDESSVLAQTLANSWTTFRKNYPTREFYLLQPAGFGSRFPKAVKAPADFLTDPLAHGPINVNRDNGKTSLRSDWFALCNLGSAVPGTRVVLSIDKSGSMNGGTVVSASYNYFIEQCKAANIPIAISDMGTKENWITPFDKAF